MSHEPKDRPMTAHHHDLRQALEDALSIFHPEPGEEHMAPKWAARARAALASAPEGVTTGWPPGLLQDDCRGLSAWLASRPDALRRVREACAEIASAPVVQEGAQSLNEQRYAAVREFGSSMKLYLYDDEGDLYSGDWRYKPTPSEVDKFADEWIAKFGPASTSAAEDERDAERFLCAEDLADLRRLDELFSDGMPYDLEKARMQHLAKLGVIRHASGGYYAITAFGRHCVDPEWGLPLRTTEQINAEQDRVARAAQEPKHG